MCGPNIAVVDCRSKAKIFIIFFFLCNSFFIENNWVAPVMELSSEACELFLVILT